MKQNSKLICIKSIKKPNTNITLYTKNKIYNIANIYPISFISDNQIYIEDNFGIAGMAFLYIKYFKIFYNLTRNKKT